MQEIVPGIFRKAIDPHFAIRERLCGAGGQFIAWEKCFCTKSRKLQHPQVIRGVSLLRFGDDGKVTYHRDYRETGEELYAKLPLIGSAVRFLQRAIG
ncbi:MAG TPA: hypothetical protein VKD04_13700 [Burkholderiales bacterium]|nr:hypothetical protein [Burkholderiales bacterium]